MMWLHSAGRDVGDGINAADGLLEERVVRKQKQKMKREETATGPG